MPPHKPTIGIWGPVNAGKTSYLASLIHELRKRETRYKISYEKGSAAEKFDTTIATSLIQGNFPPPTRSDIIHEPYVFSIAYEPQKHGDLSADLNEIIRHRDKSYTVEFYDGAGGHCAPTNDEGEDYFNKLVGSDGILMMIDVNARGGMDFGHPDGTYYSTLKHLFEVMESVQTPIITSFAFCLTKSDLDKQWRLLAPYWRKGNVVTNHEILETAIGQSAYNLVLDKCKPEQISVFATSITGRYITKKQFDRPNVVSIGDGEFKIIDTECPRHHVIEPLLWLFDKIDEKLQWHRKILRHSHLDNI